MDTKVLLSVENYISRVGLSSIITNGIISSKITHIEKEEIIKKIELNSFDIVIVDFNKNNPFDFELINQIIKTDSKLKLFILTSRSIDVKTLRFINKNAIGLILDSFSYKNIIKLINFRQINYHSGSLSHIRNRNKTQVISKLLSDRELEVALMLLKGESITSISEKKKLAITTISTYKKRIFEKTKVKSLVEMVQLFNKTVKL